jgi:perosamine synthetase
MTNYTIPVYRPDLSGNERRYVLECLDSSWISSKGRFIGDFETRFAEACEARHAISVCNGTVALHLALVTLGIGPGDEVIVPTLTYIAAVNSIVYTGATPVFVDSRADTWQMDPADVARQITPRTKAIMAVHLYGHPCDMDALGALARARGVFLIEDCAEAFGAKYKGRPVGTFGDISTFSFYGNKTITTGEGGMVITNDQTLAERARHFKGQGLAAHREYWHDVVGYNYRMTNICAAIGLAQLERAEEFLSRKARLAEEYQDALADAPIEFHAPHGEVKHSFWMISILVETAAQRDPLRSHLAQHGVETRPLFYPAHTMPMYSTRYRRHPVAENLAWRGINLPSWPGMADSEIKHVADAICGFFASSAKPAPAAPTPAAASRDAVCERLSLHHADSLGAFFGRLRASGVEDVFHPHPLTPEEAANRAGYKGRDYYCVMIHESHVIGYGMLRGWDQGYEVPSLGIAIDAAFRGRGYGRQLMNFLKAAAQERGARRIRLKAHAENEAALGLYRKLGYVFHAKEGGELVGYLDLRAASGSPEEKSG